MITVCHILHSYYEIYEILKTGEIADNGSTIEARVVETASYGEDFEEVTSLILPKALYTLLTKE
jgi:hypothetical protein